MKVLGISGLAKSESYKRLLYPHLDSSEHRIRQGLTPRRRWLRWRDRRGRGGRSVSLRKADGSISGSGDELLFSEQGLRMDQMTQSFMHSTMPLTRKCGAWMHPPP
jgi:hypothetical protein